MARLGTRLGIRRLSRGQGRSGWRDGLKAALCASGIALEAEEVALAAAASAITGMAICGAMLAVVLVLLPGYLLAVLVATAVVPVVLREVTLEIPDWLAKKKAAQLAREAPDGTHLMVMSLRHEPSLSKSISFASRRRGAFSAELRACVWRVLVGRHASFEEALMNFSSTWQRYCPDIKTAIDAMITASCESTEDGKRRALDRASRAMVAGTKRRIEEYALSLSLPSMLLFGVGILLPLMVGSFLPMTSWGVWSYGTLEDGQVVGGNATLQTAVVMNLLFPSIALIVGIGAVARHPMESGRRSKARALGSGAAGVMAVTASCAIAVTASTVMFEGTSEGVAVFMSIALPVSAALALAGRAGASPEDGRLREADIENALFRTGAAMVEGENFESALHRSSRGLGAQAGAMVEGHVFGSTLGMTSHPGRGQTRLDGSAEALILVGQAAEKDEQSAGLLAMDLALYLRDLRELESTLKTRLKPTISMMKTTAYALGPFVLGITFAIYLALSQIVSPGASMMGPETFFMILGVFLLEINLVVTYFIWGIEGDGDRSRLLRSAGLCTLCSSVIFSASALIAS